MTDDSNKDLEFLQQQIVEGLGIPAELLDEGPVYAGSSVALQALDEQDRILDTLTRALIAESPDTELGAATRRVLEARPEILVVDNASYRQEVAAQSAARIRGRRVEHLEIDEVRDYGSFERNLVQKLAQKLYQTDPAQFDPPRSGTLAAGLQTHQDLEDFYVRKGRAIGKSTSTAALLEAFESHGAPPRPPREPRISVGTYHNPKERARAKMARKSRRKNRK